ncbi:MAG: biphenyl 2,3-dioxygenase [Pseudomonadota bacterium]
MHRVWIAFIALTIVALTIPAMAAGDLTRQKPITVSVSLGTNDGAMAFVPNELTFETGKLYKLVLFNPSDVKHYFTSKTLASKVFTRKVQVIHNGERLAEIKGTISEIEVFPGGTSEWWFVPVSTGTFSDLHCHVKSDDGKTTHADMGMVGTITIK